MAWRLVIVHVALGVLGSSSENEARMPVCLGWPTVLASWDLIGCHSLHSSVPNTPCPMQSKALWHELHRSIGPSSIMVSNATLEARQRFVATRLARDGEFLYSPVYHD